MKFIGMFQKKIYKILQWADTSSEFLPPVHISQIPKKKPDLKIKISAKNPFFMKIKPFNKNRKLPLFSIHSHNELSLMLPLVFSLDSFKTPCKAIILSNKSLCFDVMVFWDSIVWNVKMYELIIFWISTNSSFRRFFASVPLLLRSKNSMTLLSCFIFIRLLLEMALKDCQK